MASTTRALEAAADHGHGLAIAVQACVLVLLIALVGGAMLTVAQPVSPADDTVEGNAASPPARHEPSSATFVSGPPGGLLILLVVGEGAAALRGIPDPVLSTGGPLDINIVEVAGPAGRAAFLRAFTDADSVCGASPCRATWVVELAPPD
jgi:hypothetical protein